MFCDVGQGLPNQVCQGVHTLDSDTFADIWSRQFLLIHFWGWCKALWRYVKEVPTDEVA